MARKITALIVLSLFVAGMATPAYCGDALKKLGRGVCNVVTCPLEIIEQTTRTNNSDGPTAAITVGLLKGIGMTLVRGVVGVYEVATFPIPLPKHYEPILRDPEFFLENMDW